MKGWNTMKNALCKNIFATLLAGGLAWNCAAGASARPAEPAPDAPAAPTAPEKTEPALEEPAGANVTVTLGEEMSVREDRDRGSRRGE